MKNICILKGWFDMEKFKQYSLKTVAALLSFVAISSVNSACAVIFGQEKEPDSLAKYKKY